MNESNRDLNTIAAEIGGIAHTLGIISTALDPHDEFEHHPEAYTMSLWSIAQYLERIQAELDDAHMRLEVKPRFQ